MSKQALLVALVVACCAGTMAHSIDAEFGPPLASRTPLATHAPDWRLFEWPLRESPAAEIEGLWRVWEDDEELAKVVTWLGENAALPLIYDRPKVYIATPVKLSSASIDPLSAGSGHNLVPAIGRYDDTMRTIYLPFNWSLDTAAGKSALVHQITLHLQNLAGQKYECPQARSRVAFEAQALWLRQFGKSLKTEFGVGAEEYLYSTECYIP